jgi:thiamine biosynthesis lipoprotein
MTHVARPAMGCLFQIYLFGDDPEHLAGAAEEALAEVQRLDEQLSHYRDDSDVARLNALAASEWVRVEPRLFALLERCAVLSRATNGAFDITAGPLEKAWGFYRGEGRVPGDEELATLRKQVGMSHVVLNRERSAVRFDAAGLEITFGAIGKGYALDEAAEVLRFYGVESALLHGGRSTIYALGAPPGAAGWEFTLRDPRDRTTPLQTVLLRDQAISTSADTEQFFEVDGVRYGHILDPRTGWPVGTERQLPALPPLSLAAARAKARRVPWLSQLPAGTTADGSAVELPSPSGWEPGAGSREPGARRPWRRSVWVIAPSATDSDALSTAFFVLGPEETRAFCRRCPELSVVMAEASPDGEALTIRRIGPDWTDNDRGTMG